MVPEIILFTIALLLSYFITKKIIEASRGRKLLGKDMHKPNKPLVAEFGGLGFSLGFILSAFISIGLFVLLKYPDMAISEALYTTSFVIAIATTLGLMSDLFKFKWGTNAILPAMNALPLVGYAMYDNMTIISTPFGSIQLGPVGYLLALLLGATGSANAINMIAGYNGLEAGMTLIIVATLSAMAFVSGNIPVVIIGLLGIGALLGFLYWNKYPAKVFPGDVGTWSFGSLIFVMAVLGKLEFWAVLLFALYFVNLAMMGVHLAKKGKKRKFAKVTKRGILKSDVPTYTLYFWLINKFKLSEKGIIIVMYLLQAIVSIIVLAISVFTGGI